MPMWITKKTRENVKRKNILKKAGYKIKLPFGSVSECKSLTNQKHCLIIKQYLTRGVER